MRGRYTVQFFFYFLNCRCTHGQLRKFKKKNGILGQALKQIQLDLLKKEKKNAKKRKMLLGLTLKQQKKQKAYWLITMLL